MTHRDDAGNVQVDFVWGNFPMQPDDDRTDSGFYTNGPENVGWSGTYVRTSDTLRIADYNLELNNLEVTAPADNHDIAAYGWSNFPAYIENYAGDGDAALEQVVPDLVRKSIGEAEDILYPLNFDLFATGHYIDIFSLVSDGTTVRVYAYDSDRWDDDVALVGLKAGDKVWVDNNEYNFGADTPVTITQVHNEGENSWFEFETATDLGLDTTANGTVWAGPELDQVITLMRFWNQPGDIKNEGTRIHVRYLEAI